MRDASLDPLSLVLATLSAIILLYISYNTFARLVPQQALPNYAFTASTKLACHTPTVLQFSARVPLGVGATPTIICAFNVPEVEAQQQHR